MGPKAKKRSMKSQEQQRLVIASYYKDQFYNKTDKKLNG